MATNLTSIDIKNLKEKKSFFLMFSIFMLMLGVVFLSLGFSRYFGHYKENDLLKDIFIDVNGQVDESFNFWINFLSVPLMYIVIGSSFVILSILSLITSIKFLKKIPKENKVFVSNVGQAFSQNQPGTNILEKEDVFCEYCGSKLQQTDFKCPNCGASKKIRN